MSEKKQFTINVPVINWVVVFCVGLTLILAIGKTMGRLPDMDGWVVVSPTLGLLALIPACLVIIIALSLLGGTIISIAFLVWALLLLIIYAFRGIRKAWRNGKGSFTNPLNS
mgnify:CR=1 FL=1